MFEKEKEKKRNQLSISVPSGKSKSWSGWFKYAKPFNNFSMWIL